MADSKMTHKQAVDVLRASYMQAVSDFLSGKGEDVLVTGTNEIALPCVDGLGDDQFIVLTFKIPTGSRDGTPYDGYHEADCFASEQKVKREKAAEAAAAKAAKIAKDKAAREAKAKAKAERNAQAEG